MMLSTIGKLLRFVKGFNESFSARIDKFNLSIRIVPTEIVEILRKARAFEGMCSLRTPKLYLSLSAAEV